MGESLQYSLHFDAISQCKKRDQARGYEDDSGERTLSELKKIQVNTLFNFFYFINNFENEWEKGKMSKNNGRSLLLSRVVCY